MDIIVYLRRSCTNKQHTVMANSGYKVVIKNGNYAFKQPGLNLPGLDLERALVDFVLAKGLATNPSKDCCTLLPVEAAVTGKFRVSQDLAGTTLITHNLGLPSPFLTNVDVRNSGGLQVLAVVSLETANTVTINAGTVTGATITIS